MVFAEGPIFATTSWSAVMAAQGHDARAREAWGRLAQAYWYPLYAYARRRGCPPEVAADKIQGFFARLLEQHGLDGVTRGQTRFSAFLLTCLRHYLADELKHDQAARRCPPSGSFSLDALEAEQRYLQEPVDAVTPEILFDRRWSREVLDLALDRLEGHYRERGKQALFSELVPHLTKDDGAIPLVELANRFGASAPGIRKELERLRRRLQLYFREEVAATVAPGLVEQEMRSILEVLTQ